jgi:two-component system response regulator YesN
MSYKLVIIDDKHNVIDGIARLGQWDDHDITFAGSAGDGQEALALIDAVQPDIAITDISMPLMDGLSFAETALIRIPHLKIIVLSGYDQFEYAQRAIHLGVLEYLTKPIKIEQIVEAVLKARDRLIAERTHATEIEALHYQRSGFHEPADPDSHYPAHIERDVILALKAGAELALTKAINRFFESLQSDPGYLRTASFELLAVTMRALSELGIENISGATPFAAELNRAETLNDLKNTLYCILSGYVRQIDAQRRSQNTGAVDRAREYIHDHWHQEISLDDVAGAVHFTAGYLAHLFKKATGETVVEYISRLKMERAAELICVPDTKIGAVAQAVGYSDRRYFTELFRRRYGCSPSEYRERFVSGNYARDS